MVYLFIFLGLLVAIIALAIVNVIINHKIKKIKENNEEE